MNTVVQMRAIDAEPPSADAISKLEEVLEVAREGGISSLAVAIVYRDGTTGRCWSEAPSYSCLLGAVTRLQHALIRDAEG